MNARRIAWSIVGLLSVSTAGRALDPIATLTPSDVPPGWTNGFGASVAIRGNYIVVGAPRDPWYNGDDPGAAYVFRRQGRAWIEAAKLTATDSGWLDQLGWSVAIDGDVIVVGAPHYVVDRLSPSGPGAVYVFRRDDHGTPDDPTDDTWGQEAKLTAPDPQFEQLFGWSVAVSGDVIVAGKPGFGHSAEVFRYDGTEWSHEVSLIGSKSGVNGLFGQSVAIHGKRIVVGDPKVDDRRGAVYVFTRRGMSWIEDAELVAGDRAPLDDFGFSVSASRDYIAVGAPHDDDAGASSGSTYLFVQQRGAWIQQTKLAPSGNAASSEFGQSVALDENSLLVGSPGDHEAGSHTGASFLFRRVGTAWTHASKLTATDLSLSARLGSAVALHGDWGLAARWDKVYAYRVCEGCGTLREFADFQNCFLHGAIANRHECARFDDVGDGVVGLTDFVEFLGTWVGP